MARSGRGHRVDAGVATNATPWVAGGRPDLRDGVGALLLTKTGRGDEVWGFHP